MLKIYRFFPGRWLPTTITLFFYSITTVIGGLWFLTPYGKADLYRSLAGMSPAVMADIGSPVYLAVLLLPYFFLPAFAYFGILVVKVAFQPARIPSWLKNPEVKTAPLLVLSIFAVAFCIYRLAATNALIPDLNNSYEANILRRVELFDSLGSTFFLITYGFLPILCVIFFARFMFSRRWLDLIGFLAMYLFFYFVIFDTLSKSHLLVVAVMLICAVPIAGDRIWYIPAIAVASFACFLIATLVLNGAMQRTHITATAMPTHDARNTLKAADALKTPEPIAFNPVKNIIYRMATPYPFYIHVFNNENERCGIEAKTVRQLLRISPSECILPIKIFSYMNPDIKWVQGFAPAAAHVSAYGEAGFLWSIIVMAISGFVLGILGAITMLGRGPLYVAFGVASCTFAYYLSQLPLVATFTYGHGLIFLNLPIFILLAVSAVPMKIHRPQNKLRTT